MGFVLPPAVGCDLAAVEIDAESLGAKDADAVGIEVEGIDIKSGAHDDEFAFGPVGLIGEKIAPARATLKTTNTYSMQFGRYAQTMSPDLTPREIKAEAKIST